jgi:filamentous hemagglutinin family protein
MSSHQTRTQSAQFKVRPLIGAIALALAAPAAFAAAPAAGALPGTFYSSTTASYLGNGTQATIAYTAAGTTVMQWGATFSGASSVSPSLASSTGAAMNNVAGFNIGAGATLTINNSATVTAGTGLLISDVTGQASQIYGKVTASSVGALFIANANGVVLDAGGAVNNGTSGGVAFLGFAQDAATFATATTASVGVNVGAGQTLLTKGDVTVNGAVTAGTVLVAGAGNVNVAQSDAAAGWNIFAGENFTYNGGATATASGAFAGGSAAVVNLTGGASSGSSAFSGATVVAAGNVNLNNYISSFTSATIAGTLTNNGVLSASIVSAGGVVNNGVINATAASTLTATTGDVVNNGIINASGAVTFSAASTTGNVTNNGSILNAGDVTLSAGASAGTAANNGTINFAASSAALSMTGFNVNLYGTVNANVGTVATALSATNALGAVNLSAATAGGVLNLGTTLFASTTSTLAGAAVRVVSGGLTDGNGVTVNIGSGPVTSGSNTYGYNLSVFNGATLSAGTAGTVTIAGATGASGSNINLDGTVAGQMIDVNANNINGLGGFNITTSSGGSLAAIFSGNFNAPNGAAARSGAGNFLYNYVPVNVASNGTATINLDPTNTATTAQLVNVLVNGSATVLSNLRAPVNTSGSIVAQASYPNSHLVFQATGNMTVGDTTGFYWPGLMYLGTINAGQPGSLSTLGTISLAGSLNNVIPTNVASQGGIWFMTSNPLSLATGATVLTNTNSWINFPAATGFAAAYGAQNATSKTFYGMVPNPTVNTILNTGVLASNMFYGR